MRSITEKAGGGAGQTLAARSFSRLLASTLQGISIRNSRRDAAELIS